MYPNIVIGNIVISNWYAAVIVGAIVTMLLAVYSKPPGFPLSRKEIFVVSVFLFILGLFGARLLYIFLHIEKSKLSLRDIFSFQGGFAYFGTFILTILTILIYAKFRKVRSLALLDYGMPFLLLSQAFVRVGCLMAGCCYGRPTPLGVVFKTVDSLPRHPTQAYEAIVILLTYYISRSVYAKKASDPGVTFSAALGLYGAGRFLVEVLRTDSPTVVLNLTLAQLSCLAIIILAILVFCLRKLPIRI